MMTRIAAIGAMLTIGTAHAATISFAADNDPTEPTLLSFFDTNTNTTRVVDMGPTFTVLLIDAEDGSPATAINAHLSVNFDLAYQFSTPVGGVFSHLFSLTGSFEFRDATTDEFLLSGSVNEAEAVLAAIGTATTVMSGLITGFDIQYNIGSIVGGVVGFEGMFPGDFGFTITALNHGLGADLILNQDGEIIGIEPFEARASFSGSFIPAPGAAGAMAFIGLLAARRRR
ncbi:MAG: hypothetical protein EA379_01965 [Phycisphaerales bacterium]|jgi:hypothetical protein|nr:MAG: hypothetical protein EA379_01965 [Phycisphaerales bacterium]